MWHSFITEKFNKNLKNKKKKKILITGCGRSGTAYITALLRENGIDVGHEKEGRDGIVSWLMTGIKSRSAFGPSFEDYEFDMIFHQVRNPVDTISSALTITDISWEYIKKHIPIEPADSKLIMAAKYWYYWNEMAEKVAILTYQIEDIETQLPKIINLIKGGNFNKKSFEKVSKKTNSRNHDRINLKDIEKIDKSLYFNILKLAKKYGYKEESMI